MISKIGAEYLLKTYEKLFNMPPSEDEGYVLIRDISHALQTVIDGESTASIEKIISNLKNAKFRRQFSDFLAKDEDIRDSFNDLVIDLLDDELEIKATHKLPSLQIRQDKRHENVLDSSTASNEFKKALDHFLQSYPNAEKKLISSVSALYKSVTHEQGFDADKIGIEIDNILRPLLKDIYINSHQKNALERLVKSLGETAVIIQKKNGVATNIERGKEQKKDVAAFHALNAAYYGYILPNFQKNRPQSEEQSDEFDFLGKEKVIEEERGSFWNRYKKSIIASTVAGAMTGASGGAIAGGAISALSAPFTGGLSLLGAPFLVGVGAAIGAGIGAITGLLIGIALSVHDYHKTKNNPQKLQKEAEEFPAVPEELPKPENEITDKNSKSYREIIELSAGDQRLIDSLKKSQAKQSQSTPTDPSFKIPVHSEIESFERDESDSFFTDKNKNKEEDSEEDSFNRDRSNSF